MLLCSNMDRGYLRALREYPSSTLDVRFLAAFSRNDLNLVLHSDEALRWMEQPKVDEVMLSTHTYRTLLTHLESLTTFVKSAKPLDSLGQDVEETKKEGETAEQTRPQKQESVFSLSDLRKSVVGIDYMGNEKGRPFCPFFLKEFIDLARDWREKFGRRFGFRIHFGEVMPLSQDPELVKVMFNHIYVICQTIALIHVKDPLYGALICFFCCILMKYFVRSIPLRIGHGVGIGYVLHLHAINKVKEQFVREALDRLTWIIQSGQILCFEIARTSNEYILGHQGGPNPEVHALPLLLWLGIPCVLCTDDDGIIPLGCDCTGKPHRSLEGLRAVLP